MPCPADWESPVAIGNLLAAFVVAQKHNHDQVIDRVAALQFYLDVAVTQVWKVVMVPLAFGDVANPAA